MAQTPSLTLGARWALVGALMVGISACGSGSASEPLLQPETDAGGHSDVSSDPPPLDVSAKPDVTADAQDTSAETPEAESEPELEAESEAPADVTEAATDSVHVPPAPDGSDVSQYPDDADSGSEPQPDAVSCGNGVIDPGEDCEPANNGDCGADCRFVVCGDGVLAGREQCDDGNTTNLDGCDSTCMYEVVMRSTKWRFAMGDPPSYCAGNQAMTAYSQIAAIQVDLDMQSALDSGSYSMILQFRGMTDLTGMNNPNVEVATLSGTLDPRQGDVFVPGALDRWFIANDWQIDNAGVPLFWMKNGSITNGVLMAGPGEAVISGPLGEVWTDLRLRDVRLRAHVAPAPPNTPASPPSALAPGISVLQSMTMEGPEDGLCGAVMVESLAQAPVLAGLTTGTFACNPNCSNSKQYYDCVGQGVGPTCNSLLDVIVGGCKVTPLCIAFLSPTQPDVGTDGNPPVVLVNEGPYNKVTPPAPYDGYTQYMTGTTHRAHLTNNLP